MRHPVLLLLLVVLAALVAWQGLVRFGTESGDTVRRTESDPAAPPLAEQDVPANAGAATDDSGPTLAGDATTGASRPARSEARPDAATGGVAGAEAKAVATYAGAMPTGWHAAPAAQRPHAIRPPRPRGPSVRPGGSSGGVGPTGHWSRFPPPGPPKGDASIHVVVTDAHGAPVSAADVYLGPPESLQSEAVSFGDLRKLGATDERGRLLAANLPAGAAVLTANVANQLNGPRGLDARSGIPVLLISRRAVRAHLQFPFDTGAFGAVAGRVVDDQQRPIARAEIRCGFFRTYADAEGRFEAPHLPAGAQTLTARRSGYATGTIEVDVPRGGTRSDGVDVVLAWAESGGLSLEGRVLTADGAGLEGATLYLIDEAGRGTLRSVRSGAEGRYVIEALPERLRTTALRVQADKFREGYPAASVRLEDGLTDARLDVRLPPRQVRVRFALRDAATGDPIDRCRVEVERLDQPETSARGFTGSRPDGVYEHFYPAGRYRFAVEAPDRETQVVEADLAPPGGEVDLAVVFPSTGEAGVQVTVSVRVLDLSSDAPVTACSIVVLDEQGREVARYVGGTPDGRYSLPVPSGPGVLRVSAEGYETSEEDIVLAADPPEAMFVSYLAPR